MNQGVNRWADPDSNDRVVFAVTLMSGVVVIAFWCFAIHYDWLEDDPGTETVSARVTMPTLSVTDSPIPKIELVPLYQGFVYIGFGVVVVLAPLTGVGSVQCWRLVRLCGSTAWAYTLPGVVGSAAFIINALCFMFLIAPNL
jgi:hypothetical protein